MNKIRVLIVDDSALVRAILTEVINAQPGMTVAGAAPDSIVAREMIRQTDPAVPATTAVTAQPLATKIASTERLLLIGASTGGTEAIKVVLQQMPPDAPGTMLSASF